MEEKQAIDQLNEVNMNGLEYLVTTYYFQAVRAAYLIVRDKAQAEDIVQTFFLNLPQKIRTFDRRLNFRPWLMKSIVNASLNVLGETVRYTSLDDADFSEDIFFAELADSRPLPEEQIVTQESRQTIWNSLGKLTPNQRAVIVMRYYLQMNEAEMAQQMGRPRSSIKWWLHSAKDRLRSLIHPSAFSITTSYELTAELKGHSRETKDYE